MENQKTEKTIEQKIKMILEKSNEDLQLVIAIEELSELQKSICKVIRNGRLDEYVESVKEEIADCLIMITQLIGILKVGSIEKEIHRKLDRTISRL